MGVELTKPKTERTILVVDDEPFVLRLLEYVLIRAGYKVLQAQDGHQALEAMARQTPDLVICDIMMPHVDGYGLIRSLRQDMRYAHIPIVVLTAMSQDQDKNRAPRLGANAFLTKPFTSAQVVSRVRELLS